MIFTRLHSKSFFKKKPPPILFGDLDCCCCLLEELPGDAIILSAKVAVSPLKLVRWCQTAL